MVIEYLDLTPRAYKCLRKAGITTTEELTSYTRYELSKIRRNKMNRIKELKMLVEEKSKLEKELAGTKNFEDRVKLSYRIGGLLACIVLEGKNIFLIKEIDIVDREMQVKQIKNRIKAIKEQEGETEYLLDLYKQLGLKETWLFTVKNTRNK